VNGKGFDLTVPAQYANGNRLDLWFMTNGPVAAEVTASSLDGSSTTVHLAPYNNYIVSFESSGLAEDLRVSMVNSGTFSSAQGGMSFGAAALTPVAVPEPNLNCLLSIVAFISALYLMSLTNCFLPPPPK
jgi:hypothetical protein